MFISGAAHLHLRHAQERHPEPAEQEEAEGQRGRRLGRDGLGAPGGRPLPIAGNGWFTLDPYFGKYLIMTQFQVNTLRRYKKHYKVPSRPGLNKAQLADVSLL